jgi:hypothetical protein
VDLVLIFSFLEVVECEYMVHKMKIFLKDNWVILFSLTFLSGICLLFSWKDLNGFWLNLLTEIIGVSITVLLIDFLVKKREEQKVLGLRLVAFKRVSAFLGEFNWFWRELYRASVPDPEPDSVEKFYSNPEFDKTWQLLNLNAKLIDESFYKEIPYLQEMTLVFHGNYWAFIPSRMIHYKDSITEILNSFGQYMEPELYSKLYELKTSELFRILGKHMDRGKEMYDIHVNNNLNPTPSLRKYYGKAKQKDLETILFIHNWTAKNYELYKKYDLELKKNPIYFNFLYNKEKLYKGNIKPRHMLI